MSCHGFLSPPEDIEVKVGESSRVRGEPKPAVYINDPLQNYSYALPPDSAKKKAERIEKMAESRGCIRLAEDIYKIAEIVEDKQ